VRRIHTGIINNSDDVRAKILQFASMAPHPVSLQDILRASSEPRQDGAAFLHEEFSIRCAERILMMEESIPGWEAIPELSEAHSLHMNSFAAVQNIHLDDSDSLDDFTTVARSIVENTRDMVKLMCKGMCVLVRSDEQQDINEAFVNKFLNEFLLNRIGSNVLMSQYLSICGDTPTSIVDPHCDVTDICRKTSRAVQALCAQETGFHPNIRVEAHSSGNSDTATFAFIPAALSYILQELLKNSSVATSKAVSSSHSDRPISVVVCYDDRRVMICIGDRAGGIPFDVGQHVWSYLYTTKKRDDSDDLEKSGATELTGFGVGLPLSRLYASYLGGSLNLVSLPGYGTHAYVFLPRLPQELVEIVPRRDYGCDLSKSGGEFIL
jgi:pyruvate dehydrogenase kinase 2/3/4